MPLDLSDAPFRDMGTPLLAYLRELTADREPSSTRDAGNRRPGPSALLHNQRALYIKRLLLFEPHVIL